MFAIVFVIALGVAAARASGRLGLIVTLLNVVALTAVVCLEFLFNLVFPYVDPSVIAELQAGPMGQMLTIASILFLVATLAFVAVLTWRGGSIPRVPPVLDALAAFPIALRAFMPAWMLPVGLAVLAAALVWLSLWMLRQASRATTPTTT